MNAKIIGMVSALALLTACSPKDENSTSSVNTSVANTSIASMDSSVATMDASSVAASTVGDATVAPASSVLIDTYWKLIALGTTEVAPSPHQREVHVVFSTDNRITGSDGCNTMSGTYAIEGETLKLSDVATTEMACDEGADVASAYKTALTTATRFSIHADQLELRDESGLVLARFQAGAQPQGTTSDTMTPSTTTEGTAASQTATQPQ